MKIHYLHTSKSKCPACLHHSNAKYNTKIKSLMQASTSKFILAPLNLAKQPHSATYLEWSKRMQSHNFDWISNTKRGCSKTLARRAALDKDSPIIENFEIRILIEATQRKLIKTLWMHRLETMILPVWNFDSSFNIRCHKLLILSSTAIDECSRRKGRRRADLKITVLSQTQTKLKSASDNRFLVRTCRERKFHFFVSERI